MDIFVEQLVKKRRGTKDLLLIIGGIIGALIVIYLMGTLMMTIPFIGFAIFIVAGLLIYLIYLMITSVNLEYEYVFTNGALDVDAIINTRKRKRITELNARNIEIMGTHTNTNFDRYMNNSNFKHVYACIDKNSPDLYFIAYNEDGKGKILLFNPNKKIVDGFKKFNPQKVEL